MSRNSGGGLEEGNSLQDQVISEGLREFHLQGGEINDWDIHNCSVIINWILFFSGNQCLRSEKSQQPSWHLWGLGTVSEEGQPAGGGGVGWSTEVASTDLWALVLDVGLQNRSCCSQVICFCSSAIFPFKWNLLNGSDSIFSFGQVFKYVLLHGLQGGNGGMDSLTGELARPRSLGRRELSGYSVLVVMMSSTTSVLWYYHEAGMASLKHSRVMTRT